MVDVIPECGRLGLLLLLCRLLWLVASHRSPGGFLYQNRNAEVTCLNPLDDKELQHLHGCARLQHRLDATARARRVRVRVRDRV